MALVEVCASDEMRVILCLRFDRRARFDAIAKFKSDLIACTRVVHSVESSGAFDFIIEAGLPDFLSYHALLDQFAEPLARLVERQEASFVCRRFIRAAARNHAIWVPCREGHRRIACSSINLVRAEGDYVRLYCDGQSWLLHDTMRHVRERLDPVLFLTLHRSSIINVNFIARLNHRRNHWVAILADGGEQRISKSHVVSVLAALRTSPSAREGDPPARSSPVELTQTIMEKQRQRTPVHAI